MSGLVGSGIPAFTAGASEVKSNSVQINSSTTRTTMATPASGKRIRVVAVFVGFEAVSSMGTEIFFGTGTNIDTNVTNAVAHWRMVSSGTAGGAWNEHWQAVFPDGGGPIGDADEILSVRAHQSHGNVVRWVVHYREE